MTNLEELLKIIEEESTTPKEDTGFKKETRSSREVKKFIKKFQIKPGEVRYPNHVIYYLYTEWTGKVRKLKAVGLNGFFREFSKHFKSYRNGRQRFYLLDNVNEITETIVEKADRKKERGKKNRKASRSKQKS